LPTLFSYVVRTDYGPAPNPFWGVCTLVICKPKIRRRAQVGDWIVGTGPVGSPIGDIRGMMIYTMQVTGKMTMREYDLWAREHLPEKMPNKRSNDPRPHVGDAIWDFSEDPPRRRPGSVHGIHEGEHDLKGGYALLSEHFFYFGDDPVPLPEHLQGLVQHGQGHRSVLNAPYLEPFVEWFTGLDLPANTVHGDPVEWGVNRPTSAQEVVPLGPRPQRHQV
jgi:hypothetical protein